MQVGGKGEGWWTGVHPSAALQPARSYRDLKAILEKAFADLVAAQERGGHADAVEVAPQAIVAASVAGPAGGMGPTPSSLS